jgi:hypothetical protein
VKAGEECAVTTPSQNHDGLTRQLLNAASEFSSAPVPDAAPARITVGNQRFVVAHDRKGGEAFVLLKAKN